MNLIRSPLTRAIYASGKLIEKMFSFALVKTSEKS